MDGFDHSPLAYFLVAHGSRHPANRESMLSLAKHLCAILPPSASGPVGIGALELDATPLDQQLVEFCRSLPPTWVQVIPIFLLPGTHVTADLPQAVTRAQQKLCSHYQLVLSPHLGQHPQLHRLFRPQGSMSPEAWILVGHGSKRPAGYQAIEKMARRLNMKPAYWVGEPSLAQQLQFLKQEGIQQVGLVPYFLFPGRIVESIAQQARDLAAELNLTMQVLAPLQPSHDMAKMILDLGSLAAPPLDFAC
ncbi:sirohydrochlorin chelatase [Lyngbya confervoides]|uniref:Sirohydrochlorin chelatase n=1 Tax=Lyngbya confervoides BDU141951 TaxID=1574623 RepID=A0ABD4T2R6_9CYAN|nr:sirohydrochlorin chelatase [Lyngbya confervoides]MCM1983061.1 sirohydrochlorin chelatase [Lyngbya confervoides BDU141951]